MNVTNDEAFILSSCAFFTLHAYHKTTFDHAILIQNNNNFFFKFTKVFKIYLY